MFIPSAKSKLSLLVVFIASIILFIWVNNSRVFLEEKYYTEKLEAAQLMQKAMNVIKEHRLSQGILIDEENDPNRTYLIGEKETLITTDRGNLTAKLTTHNPNFAATIMEMFKKAKLKKGDKVALSCTGSLPALNIAVMSAAKILDLDLIIISSVGASMFGATDPDFTWLDMEIILNEKGIFQYKSVAASLGGGRDSGRGLNVVGRELIISAIERNNVFLIQENSLEKNIRRKMEFYEDFTQNSKIKLYINVGGGLSSLGNTVNGRLVSPGYHRFISTKNIPLKGTMFLFAEKNIPIIHLLDIEKFAEMNELPISPVPLPEPGKDKFFVNERYNTTITVIALAILIILILTVIFFDHKQLKLREDDVNKVEI